jgi:hypothetical protein
MEYKIIDSRYIQNLIVQVNMEINDGWIPLGGVAITARSESGYEYSKYCQAMTRLVSDNR